MKSSPQLASFFFLIFIIHQSSSSAIINPTKAQQISWKPRYFCLYYFLNLCFFSEFYDFLLDCLQSFCIWRISYGWRMQSLDISRECHFSFFSMFCLEVEVLNLGVYGRRNQSWRDLLSQIMSLERESIVTLGPALACSFPNLRLISIPFSV